ncbi:hypothetical protein SAMN04487752_0261 [Carnobacterium viridans]|uniref:Uncharacterized protein n=1 Tax=Carnobacterium viridans TaxID=174587 RepID=A0A1H0XIH4_9LACT|nr:hypothetical protein SAMN04487752_0261 [Carnobacterium viridans]
MLGSFFWFLTFIVSLYKANRTVIKELKSSKATKKPWVSFYNNIHGKKKKIHTKIYLHR